MNSQYIAKSKVLISGLAILVCFFSRLPNDSSMGATAPPSQRSTNQADFRCSLALQPIERQVIKIASGKRIKFSSRGIPYMIDVNEVGAKESVKPVERTNTSSGSLAKSTPPVRGTIFLERGESILELNIAEQGEVIIILTGKGDVVTFRAYRKEYDYRLDDAGIAVPRNPDLQGPIFHLLSQSHFPGVKKGNLSHYYQEHDSLVVGDKGSKFFYLVDARGISVIAMADFDEPSYWPSKNVPDKDAIGSGLVISYIDREGTIRGARRFDLYSFLQAAIYLPVATGKPTASPRWMNDWTPLRGTLVSTQMLEFLGITMADAKLIYEAGQEWNSHGKKKPTYRDHMERLFGPLLFGETRP